MVDGEPSVLRAAVLVLMLLGTMPPAVVCRFTDAVAAPSDAITDMNENRKLG